MNRWLRHHRYALRVALHRLRLHPLSSLANIVVIALMLTVPILGAAVLESSQPLTRQLAVTPELTLFLAPRTSTADQQALLARIQQESGSHIAQARLLPRDQAMAQLRADPAWAQALDALPENPLPDAIVVTLRDSASPAQDAANLTRTWEQWPGVAHVQMDSEWVRRLESLLSFLRLGLGLLAIAVAVVVLATVFNTVRLQALTQREEIAVARLVGATESFVRRPFLYLGALTGLAASAVAVLLARASLIPLNAILNKFAHSYGIEWVIHLPAVPDLVLWGALIIIMGAVAARLSVTRHTQF
ncbi:MAG: ABC transporter permease [Castellaniella sp.]|uniref:cell division protein FtsX n=1 Tax=Castellaniella sp. TaxID=1955812 RepID=UPI0012038554|nr:ABC transporter permease [Castellaniella sp.]TAN27206.1 MAG: ABC transporter permease [Castellaniella sp.]